jgi:hypothetical protein
MKAISSFYSSPVISRFFPDTAANVLKDTPYPPLISPLVPEVDDDPAIVKLHMANDRILRENQLNDLLSGQQLVEAIAFMAGPDFNNALTKPAAANAVPFFGQSPPRSLATQTPHGALYTLHSELLLCLDSDGKNTKASQYLLPYPAEWSMSRMLAHHADGAAELALIGRGMHASTMAELFQNKMLANHKHFEKLAATFNETRTDDSLRTWTAVYPFFLSRGEAIERKTALAAAVANGLGAATAPTPTNSASNTMDAYDEDESANAARAPNRGRQPNPGATSKPKVSVEISNLDLNAVAPLLRHHGLMLVPTNQNNRGNNYSRSPGGNSNQQFQQGQNQAGNRKPPNPPANNYSGRNNGGYNRSGNRNGANQGRGRANVAHDFDDAFDEAITDAVIAADDAAYYTGLQDEDAEDGET